MSEYIVPIIIIVAIVCCIIKKVPIYDTFTNGAKSSIDLIVKIFPCLIAIFFGVELLRVSGLSKIIADFMSPVIGFFGIPKELSELVLLRPFSGSGSLALLSEIIEQYGVDSHIVKCASVIMSASETVFYVAGVYFAGVKNKKLFFAIPISLFACFMGSVVGCLMVSIL